MSVECFGLTIPCHRAPGTHFGNSRMVCVHPRTYVNTAEGLPLEGLSNISLSHLS